MSGSGSSGILSGPLARLEADGGFWFGQKRGTVLPFVNPVSTAFGLQALALWHQHRTGTWRFQLHELI